MTDHIDRWDPHAEVFLHYDVTKLLDRHARGTDRKDWDLVRAAYHPDGVDNHGAFDGLGSEFAEFLATRPDFVQVMQHFLGRTALLEVDRERKTVLAETHGVAWQVQSDDAPAIPDHYHVSVDPETGEPHAGVAAIGFRYVDLLTERDGELLIQTRTVVYEWVGAMPLAGASYLAGKIRGIRDDSDFSYQAVAAR